MIVTGQWPNLERALIEWLRPALADVAGIKVYSAIPEGWRPPVVSIEQTAGGGGVDFDLATTIDITVYATEREAMWNITRLIHPRMVAMPGRGDVMVDEVVATSGFGVIPYANSAITRAMATYSLVTRPR